MYCNRGAIKFVLILVSLLFLVAKFCPYQLQNFILRVECYGMTFGTSYLTCSFAVSLLNGRFLGFGQGQRRSMWSYRVERGHSLV